MNFVEYMYGFEVRSAQNSPDGSGKTSLVYSHPGCPPSLFLVDGDLIGKRIPTRCGNRRDVIFVGVDVFHYLSNGGEQSLLHRLTNLGSLCKVRKLVKSLHSTFSLSVPHGVEVPRTILGLRLCNGNLDSPTFPAHLLLPSHNPRLSPFPLRELY